MRELKELELIFFLRSLVSLDQIWQLFTLADKKKNGLLSLEDFLVFENLLSSPDAEYQLAYRLFDRMAILKMIFPIHLV